MVDIGELAKAYRELRFSEEFYKVALGYLFNDYIVSF